MIWVILEAQKAPKRYVYNDFGEPAQPASQPTRLWLAGWLAGCVCFFFRAGFLYVFPVFLCLLFMDFILFESWLAAFDIFLYWVVGCRFSCIFVSFVSGIILFESWLAGWLAGTSQDENKTKNK